MKLQSLWEIAIFSQPEVGRWPSDIGDTVGPSQQQLGYSCSPRRRLHSCTPTGIDKVDALKITWFVLANGFQFVRNPKCL